MADFVPSSFLIVAIAAMHGEYKSINTIIETDDASENVEFNASLKEFSSASNTIDIVDIIASFEKKPLMSATLVFQLSNPANLKIGDIKFPKSASILLELSSVKCIERSNDCKNQTTTDELRIITPTFSRKSFS